MAHGVCSKCKRRWIGVRRFKAGKRRCNKCHAEYMRTWRAARKDYAAFLEAVKAQ